MFGGTRDLLRLAGVLIGAVLFFTAPAQATVNLGVDGTVSLGNQPSAFTDVDGVTHVVWDKSNPGSNDTLQ